MSFQLTGKLIRKWDAQELGTNGFRKRDFVIETDGQYPQPIKFELHKDNCEQISGFQQNQRLTVHFDTRGNEWKDKYYVNLVAWKVETTGEIQQATPEPVHAGADTPATQAPDGDDLPF